MNRMPVVCLTASLAALFLSSSPARAQEATPPDSPSSTEPGGGGGESDGEPSPSRAAPAGRGVLWGNVASARSKEPLLEARVTVVGSGKQTMTDYEGRFRLELPPGTYQLRVSYELHKAARIQNVRVVLGQVQQVDVALEPDAAAEETVEITAEVDKTTAEGQLLARRRSAAVGDAVGRAEIARTPDKNAAEAARRVVGATIVGSRFVFVRGLGERYTNALLNGVPLPSPEPDRQTVPLDLFPTLVLDRITIAKTFTPDAPADFAGGSVRIDTRAIPSSLVLQGSVSAGFNTQSTFRQRLDYEGSSTDWLGRDGGARQLPDGIPDYKLTRGGQRPDGSYVTNEELTEYGRQINSYMSTRRASTLPNYSASLVAGNGWSLGGGQELGVLTALSYGRSFERRSGQILRNYGVDSQSPGQLRLLNDLEAETGIDQVRWGAYGSVAWRPSPRHELSLGTLYSVSADDTAQEIEGYHEERAAIVHNTRLQYVSRALAFGQLRGKHTLTELGNAEVDWNLSLSRASRTEPDTRGTVYILDSQFGYVFEDDSDSGSHFFAEQAEKSLGLGLDWKQPLTEGDTPSKVQLGGLVNLRDRDFDARRFAFRALSGGGPLALVCSTTTWDPTCPDRLFTAGNIGSALQLDETTRANDAYTAGLDVYAGYLMVDAALVPSLRVIAGERVEVTRQDVASFDPYAADVTAVATNLDSTDLLPALAVVWSMTKDSSARASATRTLARPQLRELAPFAFSDYFGARPVQGNPDLELTRILNFDLRFEHFPTVSEVIAATAFYKRFDEPIEQVVKPAGQLGIITYENADRADLYGIELEARKELGALSSSLDGFDAGFNLTLARSSVTLSDEGTDYVTNKSRPLANQSPYVVNVSAGYDNDAIGASARILYNVQGRRIAQVGTQGLPDVFEQPRHTLDVTAAKRFGTQWELKLTATNLLNSPVLLTQGEESRDDNIVSRYTTGATFTFTTSYTY